MHQYNYGETAPQNQQPQSNPANIVNVKLDKDSLHLFNITHPELRNSLINIALKAFSKDPMFSKYFIDSDLVPKEEIDTFKEEEIPENINTYQQNQQQTPMNQNSVVQSQQPVIQMDWD